jgi:hypothetical protein
LFAGVCNLTQQQEFQVHYATADAGQLLMAVGVKTAALLDACVLKVAGAALAIVLLRLVHGVVFSQAAFAEQAQSMPIAD